MGSNICGASRAPASLGAALILVVFSPCLAAQHEGGADYAALKAEATIAFKKGVGPFVKEYCTRCHSNRRSKAAINFEAALKLPGGATSSQQWKKAVANVKAHEMPPVDAPKIPTDEERQEVAGQLARSGADRVTAATRMAWALLAGTEFATNH